MQFQALLHSLLSQNHFYTIHFRFFSPLLRSAAAVVATDHHHRRHLQFDGRWTRATIKYLGQRSCHRGRAGGRWAGGEAGVVERIQRIMGHYIVSGVVRTPYDRITSRPHHRRALEYTLENAIEPNQLTEVVDNRPTCPSARPASVSAAARDGRPAIGRDQPPSRRFPHSPRRSPEATYSRSGSRATVSRFVSS